MAGTLVVGEIQTESNGDLTLNPNGTGNVSVNDTRIVTTTGNQDIELEPNGTGAVEVRGNTNAGTIKLNCENNSHAVSVQGPAHSAGATYTLVLPTAAGTANQVLDIASVSGSTIQLGWADDATGAGTTANTFTGAQSVTPADETSAGAIDFSASNFIEVAGVSYNTTPTNLTVGTSGLFYADTAAPTNWHSTFKFVTGGYVAPTTFPAVAPWYVAETDEILVGAWTQGINVAGS